MSECEVKVASPRLILEARVDVRYAELDAVVLSLAQASDRRRIPYEIVEGMFTGTGRSPWGRYRSGTPIKTLPPNMRGCQINLSGRAAYVGFRHGELVFEYEPKFREKAQFTIPTGYFDAVYDSQKREVWTRQ